MALLETTIDFHTGTPGLTIVVDDGLRIEFDTAPEPRNPIEPVSDFQGLHSALVHELLDLTDPGSSQPSLYRTVLKPIGDRVFAGALLIVLLPVIAVIAVAVGISMGFPVLFRQTRVGQYGNHFSVCKFRTMLPESPESDAVDVETRLANHKVVGDPRITRVGEFLRRSSLDELPQLWNVVRGEMSLVGPRPELPWIVDTYAATTHKRHDVKPGMTGLWQVSTRGNVKMHENPQPDLDYVAGQSLALDLSILVKTPFVAFRGH